MFSKTEGFYDAKGNYCSPGSSFIDHAGVQRQPGEGFVDASGAYVAPGSAGFTDSTGVYRRFGEAYVDSSGREISGNWDGFPSFASSSWLGGIGNMSWMRGAFDAAAGKGGGNWMAGMHQWMFSLMALGVRVGISACIFFIQISTFVLRSCFWAGKVLVHAQRQRSAGRGEQYWAGLPSFPVDPVSAERFPQSSEPKVASSNADLGNSLRVLGAVSILAICSALALVVVVPAIRIMFFASPAERYRRPQPSSSAPSSRTASPQNQVANTTGSAPLLEKAAVTPRPGVSTPPPAKSSGPPSVNIVGKSNEEHNAKVGSRIGVRIPVNLRARNLEGHELALRVEFVDSRKSVVTATDADYRGRNGQLTVAKAWTPATDDAESGLIDFFIPYGAFSLPKGRMTRVYATLQVWDGQQLLLTSRPLGMQVQPTK